MTKYNFM